MFHTSLCVRVCAPVFVSRVGSNCVARTQRTIDHSTVRGVTALPGDGGAAARRALVSLSEVSRRSKMSALDIWHSSCAADICADTRAEMCVSLLRFTKIPGVCFQN